MYFRDIIGQDAVKQQLIRSAQSGVVPHARLAYGNEGAGALPLMIAYARYLNCTDRKADDACGHCPSCLKFNNYAHPDLHFAFPVYKKKGKNEDPVCDEFLNEWRACLKEHPYFSLQSWLNHINAGNAQGLIYTKESDEIIKKLSLKIYEAEYRILILWLAEKMHEKCANKLLKIIEEPYDKTVILLVSNNPEEVIGTIRSRSQLLHIPPIAPEALSNALTTRYDLPPEEAKSIVHLAGGDYLKAQEILENNADQALFLELFIIIMRNCWRKDVRNMKAKADDFASLGREKQKLFLSFAQQLIRENFVFRLNEPDMNYMNSDEAAFSENFSPYVNERNVVDLMTELELAEKHITQNGNPRMIFFDLSMKIAVLLKK
ncbi:MAG: DNA polymerase III subunit delta [Dysgonamonadaceae bacterium]|jgi:DNA polymerase-3 subunit delta'|nr:DNA polymerase III subunit delta [Dysgonamonadaceae bacterium]